MSEIEPITREEMLLNAIAGEGESSITPVTRREHYLSAIAGETDLPAKMQEEGPLTREEIYYQKILDNGSGGGGGGGEATGTKKISITANGTTTHNVKASANAEITANVPNPSTGTKEITSNGTHDVTDFASAQVNVPNSYGSSDEGKVVSGGALVAQSSQNITANGTYDTTLKNSVNVAVPQGITPSGSQTFTENGTYDVTNLAEAVVNVSGGGGESIPVYSNVLYLTGFPQDSTEVKYDAPYLQKLNLPYDSSKSNITKAEITVGESEVTIDGDNNASHSGGAFAELDLHGANVLLSGYCLRYRNNLVKFNAKVRTSVSDTSKQFTNSSKLQTIYWQENRTAVNISMSACPLDNDSLISLGNGLSESSANTLTLSSARKTTCGTITGNSVEVAGDTTYHRFVEDANGTMTLTEFITTVKGWTLA